MIDEVCVSSFMNKCCSSPYMLTNFIPWVCADWASALRRIWYQTRQDRVGLGVQSVVCLTFCHNHIPEVQATAHSTDPAAALREFAASALRGSEMSAEEGLPYSAEAGVARLQSQHPAYLRRLPLLQLVSWWIAGPELF